MAMQRKKEKERQISTRVSRKSGAAARQAEIMQSSEQRALENWHTLKRMEYNMLFQ